MKRACLLIVVPALLVALGFAQTPTASSTTDPTTIKGCLGGSDGNYTLLENNTAHNFTITTSSVDLKPHLGHDVALIGHKASSAASPGATDNSFAVTELNMISEHCAAAAAAPAASISTPVETAIPPPADAAVSAATIPPPGDSASAPVAVPSAPPATVTPPVEGTIATAVATPTPSATVPSPPENASVPAAAGARSEATAPEETVVPPTAARRTRLPADHRRPASTPAGAATPVVASTPAETSSTPVADAATLPATDSTASANVTEPAPAVATPAVTEKNASSWIWIPIVLVVLITGALTPLFNRWRKRRLLEKSGPQNLSFSHRASSEPGNSNKHAGRKAA
jgi:hypothetical protein